MGVWKQGSYSKFLLGNKFQPWGPLDAKVLGLILDLCAHIHVKNSELKSSINIYLLNSEFLRCM